MLPSSSIVQFKKDPEYLTKETVQVLLYCLVSRFFFFFWSFWGTPFIYFVLYLFLLIVSASDILRNLRVGFFLMFWCFHVVSLFSLFITNSTHFSLLHFIHMSCFRIPLVLVFIVRFFSLGKKLPFTWGDIFPVNLYPHLHFLGLAVSLSWRIFFAVGREHKKSSRKMPLGIFISFFYA